MRRPSRTGAGNEPSATLRRGLGLLGGLTLVAARSCEEVICMTVPLRAGRSRLLLLRFSCTLLALPAPLRLQRPSEGVTRARE